MPDILFVCMANQFRSPLAAALFQKRLKEAGLSEGWTVSSAGTWVKNEGGGAHPNALIAADLLGLDLSRHATREITAKMISDADLVIVMASGQKEALQFEFKEQREKVVLLTELSGSGGGDIPDPVGTKLCECDAIVADLYNEVARAFSEILRRVNEGCQHPAKTDDLNAIRTQ